MQHSPLAQGIYMSSFIFVYTECRKGEVFTQCQQCAGTVSCANPNPKICPLVCIPGCECAVGTIRNEKTGQCVTNCSASLNGCPIQGQVRKQCVQCYGKPFTCNSPSHPCPKICAAGCECPNGLVLDRKAKRCVPLKLCSSY